MRNVAFYLQNETQWTGRAFWKEDNAKRVQLWDSKDRMLFPYDFECQIICVVTAIIKGKESEGWQRDTGK